MFGEGISCLYPWAQLSPFSDTPITLVVVTHKPFVVETTKTFLNGDFDVLYIKQYKIFVAIFEKYEFCIYL